MDEGWHLDISMTFAKTLLKVNAPILQLSPTTSADFNLQAQMHSVPCALALGKC